MSCNPSTCTIRWLSVYAPDCALITSVNVRTFSLPSKGTPHPLAGTSGTPQYLPPQALIYFLSLWVCLFQTFPINGVTGSMWCFVAGFLHLANVPQIHSYHSTIPVLHPFILLSSRVFCFVLVWFFLTG